MNEGYEIIRSDELVGAYIVLCDKELLKQFDFGGLIPAHWHRSIEFSYVLKGDVHLVMANSEKLISGNEFIFVNSGEMHSLYSNNLDTEVLIVIISYDFAHKLCPDIDEISFSSDLIEENKELFIDIYQRIYETVKNPDEYSRIRLHSLICEVFYNLLKYCQDDNKKEFSSSIKQKYWRLLYDIETHYKEDLSLKTIAAAANVSSEYFSRSFKKISGMGYHEYLTRLRLQNSLNALLDRKRKIGDIALDYGFGSAKSYIRCFEKYYHMTPLEYRRSNIRNKSINK